MMSIRLLQVLPRDSDAYNTILAQIMTARAQDAVEPRLEGSHANAHFDMPLVNVVARNEGNAHSNDGIDEEAG